MRRILLAISASLGLLASPAPAAAEAGDPKVCEGCEALLELSLANPRREQDRARDSYRHPAETLAFFRVQPGMTVVDYMPSGGWYTRVLVPYLGKEGRYIGLNPAITSTMSKGLADYLGNLSGKFAEVTAKSDLAGGAPTVAYNGQDLPAQLNGTVDRVLIFREMHNLQRNNILPDEMKRLHALLKSDGLLGIVQHRAKADAPDAYVAGDKGYMRQKDVIDMVQAHGFELVGTSEVNANPKDTADHPAGVWELPPVLRTKREELKAIGESDRMTLLFRKRT